MTSDKICEVLDEIGIPYVRGLAGTGVIATLTRGSASRTVALRADIDALPITETSNLDYRSRHEGVMHACGHDSHTIMVLGAAQQLAGSENLDGTVHFIFQPAEEHGKGALKMIADGLFDRFPCDAIFGMHNLPWLETGKFATCAGPIMGAEDNFEIRITARVGTMNLTAIAFVVGSVLFLVASVPYLWRVEAAADRTTLYAFLAWQYLIGSVLFLLGAVFNYWHVLTTNEQATGR